MAAQRPRQRSRRRHVLVVVLATALLLAVVLVRALVAVPVRISSASMAPTLVAGDVVLVSRTPPTSAGLRRGDLVAFTSPEDGRRAIKRVVGLPGDTLVILDGELHVDGQVVEESYVDHAMVDGYFSATFTVAAGTVFVLGDNRSNSVDSRDYGAVPVADLLGSVLTRVWPLTG